MRTTDSICILYIKRHYSSLDSHFEWSVDFVPSPEVIRTREDIFLIKDPENF